MIPPTPTVRRKTMMAEPLDAQDADGAGNVLQ
jgi:hypothetical protein